MHNNTNFMCNKASSYCFALNILQLQDLKNLQKHIKFSSVIIYKGVNIGSLHMTNLHRDNSTAYLNGMTITSIKHKHINEVCNTAANWHYFQLQNQIHYHKFDVKPSILSLINLDNCQWGIPFLTHKKSYTTT